MDIKVSVIIPVYNAENYLAECIESLLSQTLQECEFIFINDGSLDRSREIIETYQKRDSRIRLLNQENQGVSAARNKGLEIAAGEYVGFVDADDYVEKEMFERLYCVAEEQGCDVVISNLKGEGTHAMLQYPFQKEAVLNQEYIQKHILPYFIKQENLNSVCNKLFRTERIRECKIVFPKKVALGEDGMFNLQFFSKAEKAIYLNYAGYIYREVAGSATRNFLKHDYFKRALEVYSMELPKSIKLTMSKEELVKLKAEKLVNSVKAFIFQIICTNSNFLEKYKNIKKMINSPQVKEALTKYDFGSNDFYGRYERAVITMMKYNFTIGIFCAASYSRLRNK